MVSAGRTANSLATGARHISKRIVASYILDWILILGTAAVGGGLAKLKGNRQAFSLEDPSISYPHRPSDTVPFWAVIIVALFAPGLIIALVSLLLIPGPTAARGTSKALIWRRKIWELNTGWMGLGVTLAGALVITEGLKDIYGKPRPDLLARCDPDLSQIARYAVGGIRGLGDGYVAAPVMVNWHICRHPNDSTLSDGFASFPSGHASFSWAGMLYLTLFLCAKFAITIPYLAPSPYNRQHADTFDQSINARSVRKALEAGSHEVPPRNQAAAPPVYLLILAFIPLGAAFYISGTRWSDYRHHGFDILSGSLIGIFMAWFAFRWYHLPIRTGAGWSWGARSRDRAFFLGVGVPSYVGDEGWQSATAGAPHGSDLESGEHVLGGDAVDHPGTEMANRGMVDGASMARSKLSSEETAMGSSLPRSMQGV